MKTFKDLLKQEGPIIGLYMQSADPTLVEIVKWAGFDFIRLDNEHILYSPHQLKEMIRTSILCDIPCQVRVNDLDDIKKILDSGATGIVVPDCNSVERVRAAVRAVKYYPVGMRGMYCLDYPIGRHVRAAGCKNFEEYMKHANDIISLTIQIESVEAKNHLDELIGMEGVDMVASGKTDISQSMGIPGKAGAPEVLDMEQMIIEKALQHGKQPAVLALNREHMLGLMEKGEKVFTVSCDETIIADAFRSFIMKLKGNA